MKYVNVFHRKKKLLGVYILIGAKDGIRIRLNKCDGREHAEQGKDKPQAIGEGDKQGDLATRLASVALVVNETREIHAGSCGEQYMPRLSCFRRVGGNIIKSARQIGGAP